MKEPLRHDQFLYYTAQSMFMHVIQFFGFLNESILFSFNLNVVDDPCLYCDTVAALLSPNKPNGMKECNLACMNTLLDTTTHRQ